MPLFEISFNGETVKPLRISNIFKTSQGKPSTHAAASAAASDMVSQVQMYFTLMMEYKWKHQYSNVYQVQQQSYQAMIVPCQHTMLKQHCFNQKLVETTLFQLCVLAGLGLRKEAHTKTLQ